MPDTARARSELPWRWPSKPPSRALPKPSALALGPSVMAFQACLVGAAEPMSGHLCSWQCARPAPMKGKWQLVKDKIESAT